MRILLIHNFYREPGGEDIVFQQERELLERKGHDVIVYTRSNEEVSDQSLPAKLTLLRTMVSSTDSRNDILELARRYKPDIAHVHNTFMAISPSIYRACEETDIPVVQTIHNYRLLCPATYLYREGAVCEECIQKGLLQSIRYGCYRESRVNTGAVALMLRVHRLAGTWNRVNAFIALTNFAKQKLVDSGLPEERVHVKGNFVASDPGTKDTVGQYGIFVGRLSPEKGADVLLSAWSLLGAPFLLKIAGDGPEMASLQQQARDRGMQNVEFLGRVGRDQARELMRGARFLLLPSLWYEGFPMVLAESFAAGLPVIASRLGAMEELIEDLETGLHFAPNSPQDLAKKISWALDNTEKILQMGSKARAAYEMRFSPETNYRRLMAIYNEAITQSAGQKSQLSAQAEQ